MQRALRIQENNKAACRFPPVDLLKAKPMHKLRSAAPPSPRKGPGMVFPVGTDESEHHTTPVVTYALILANVAIFFVELNQGDAFVKEWAFTPASFFEHPATQWETLLTSMFLHGGWLHLIGNMAYLWTFGDNVEDNFGHIPFLVFYLLAGILAMFAQAAFIPNSSLPNLGASGAIAGVLGAYIILFPGGKVKLLTNVGIVQLPALIAIGGWIALQFVNAAGELAKTSDDTGGVAYMAHIGGFFAGMALALFFRTGEPAAA
jgi:membrane associated rhomboid family serine protease